MGCGASTGTAASDAYAQSFEAPSFAGEELHTGADFDAAAASDEVRMIGMMDHQLDQASMCSDGSYASEPGQMSLAVRCFKVTLQAKLMYSIDADPHQFTPEEIPKQIIAHSSAIVRRWFADVDAAAIISPRGPPTRVTSSAAVAGVASSSSLGAPSVPGCTPTPPPHDDDEPTTPLPGACHVDPPVALAPASAPSDSSRHQPTNDTNSTTAKFLASMNCGMLSSSVGGDTMTFTGFDDDDDNPTLCADILALHDKMQVHIAAGGATPKHLLRPGMSPGRFPLPLVRR